MICFLGGVPFIFFAKSDLEKWAYDQEEIEELEGQKDDSELEAKISLE